MALNRHVVRLQMALNRQTSILTLITVAVASALLHQLLFATQPEQSVGSHLDVGHEDPVALLQRSLKVDYVSEQASDESNVAAREQPKKVQEVQEAPREQREGSRAPKTHPKTPPKDKSHASADGAQEKNLLPSFPSERTRSWAARHYAPNYRPSHRWDSPSREQPHSDEALRMGAVEANLGMSANGAEDFDAFISSLVTAILVVCGSVAVFSVLRTRYPKIYAHNVEMGNVPVKPDTDSLLAWIYPSLLSTAEVEKYIGLDSTMLLETCNLFMRLLVYIGAPIVLIVCPLHVWCGNVGTRDKLSVIGLENVEDGSWLWYVHALIVWHVVIVTSRLIYRAQEDFLPRRFEWLKSMPEPLATTILLEGIPAELCSDESLKKYFCEIFDEEKIATATVVKRTAGLVSSIASLRSYEASLQAAEFEWSKSDNDPTKRPRMFKTRLLEDGKFVDFVESVTVDSIEYYTKLIAAERKTVEHERERIVQAASAGVNPDVYSSTGFVTFKRPRERDLALTMVYKSNEDKLVPEIPPDPADVIYSDLAMTEEQRGSRELLGYGLVVALLVFFIPIIGLISNLANLERLQRDVHLVRTIVQDYHFLQATLQGVLSSLALTIMMSLLPSVLMMIFQCCFKLKAYAWAQHRLQWIYFLFLLFFVVLVTAVGGSLAGTFLKLLRDPMQIFQLLAGSLPNVSHFYLNYVVLQWCTLGLNLTRYMQLLKYKTFKQIYDEETARQKSEPEDQDYHGLGSRNARFSHVMSTAVIFCSLSPLITVVAFIDFFVCRVVYGYLIVYAETRKPDLGGVFWVSMLKQMQGCLFLYIMLMAGVLQGRRDSFVEHHGSQKTIISPSALALMSLVYYFYACIRFSKLRWETLPFEEVVAEEKNTLNKRQATRDSYVQPELVEQL
eukprot:gnl/TRDRNA2_/TRDRNA2_35755_c0_seq1.p1 gnl/TRDRNA2_/TRDRNA2_35755_c0~~gnl/TRDRNA2_/TRDRNA2_35755_c0_seq1.p1  ORF type:complete len:900 (+),score=158.62 gnl/TRDRNA2_/TRDRNA2_35755_c0_seq1:74-2773(+)